MWPRRRPGRPDKLPTLHQLPTQPGRTSAQARTRSAAGPAGPSTARPSHRSSLQSRRRQIQSRDTRSPRGSPQLHRLDHPNQSTPPAKKGGTQTMNRLLDVLALLIAAMWPANRHQDFPDTAKANGPQALPAVELPRQTAPALSCATEATPGQIRRASTPDHSSKPRGASQQRPPPGHAPAPPPSAHRPVDLVARISGRWLDPGPCRPL